LSFVEIIGGDENGGLEDLEGGGVWGEIGERGFALLREARGVAGVTEGVGVRRDGGMTAVASGGGEREVEEEREERER